VSGNLINDVAVGFDRAPSGLGSNISWSPCSTRALIAKAGCHSLQQDQLALHAPRHRSVLSTWGFGQPLRRSAKKTRKQRARNKSQTGRKRICAGAIFRLGRPWSISPISREEKVARVGAPPLNGLRSYQAGSTVLGLAAHLKGITVRKIRGNFAVITDRNIRPFFAQLNMVTVVFEPMWN